VGVVVVAPVGGAEAGGVVGVEGVVVVATPVAAVPVAVVGVVPVATGLEPPVSVVVDAGVEAPVDEVPVEFDGDVGVVVMEPAGAALAVDGVGDGEPEPPPPPQETTSKDVATAHAAVQGFIGYPIRNRKSPLAETVVSRFFIICRAEMDDALNAMRFSLHLHNI